MDSSARRWRWVSAALAVLCALLLVETVRREANDRIQKSEDRSHDGEVGSRKSKVESVTENISQDSRARSQDEQAESRKLKVEGRTENRSPESGGGSQEDQAEGRQSQLEGSQEPASSQRANQDLQITKSLRPLGYVEKSGGQVEAVVEEGGEIHLVHLGDSWGDNYKVVAISREEVRIQDSEPGRQGAAVSKEPVERRALKIESSWGSSTDAAGQIGNQKSQIADSPQTLGYVERTAGRVEAVVADGERVRLVRGEPTVLAGLGSRETAEGGIRKPDAGTQKEVGDREARVESARAGSGGEIAALPRPAIQDARTLSAYQPRQIQNPESMIPSGTNDFGLTDPLEPEVLGHFGGTNTHSPLHYMKDEPPLADLGTEQTSEPGEEESVAQAETVLPENSCTSDVSPPIPQQVGYLELAGGQPQAIVALGDDVYFVREGEVFAGHFRALSVSSSWAEIEELPLKREPSPDLCLVSRPEPAREPNSRGSPSAIIDESAQAGGTGAVGAGSPGERPPPNSQRPPPRAAPGGMDSIGMRANARVGPNNSRAEPAVRWITLRPLGLAVASDGRTTAFVAVGGEVLLAREGETLPAGFRVSRVTATTVELVADSLPRGAEVARRSLGGPTGKPSSPAASKDGEPALRGSTTLEGTRTPDTAPDTGSALLRSGSESSLSGLAQEGLPSRVGMLDNPGQ